MHWSVFSDNYTREWERKPSARPRILTYDLDSVVPIPEDFPDHSGSMPYIPDGTVCSPRAETKPE